MGLTGFRGQASNAMMLRQTEKPRLAASRTPRYANDNDPSCGRLSHRSLRLSLIVLTLLGAELAYLWLIYWR